MMDHGFGYVQPPYKVSSQWGQKTYRKFCSKYCQDIYAQIKKTKGDQTVIDPTKHEIEAMAATLKPLGEYVASIGMHRGLANYTKEEILTLVEVTVTAYHDYLREAVKDEFEVGLSC
ncbi:MAG: DUF6511 domain-containing protein [Proteobacteria bacterium]|nr:DUF6511 domain-containing protein [Pseudomonadota bacterium]